MKSFKHLSFTAGYTNIKCSCAFLHYNCAVVTLKRDVSLDASLRTSIFFYARDTHWEVYLVRRELDLTVADGILGEIRRRPN